MIPAGLASANDHHRTLLDEVSTGLDAWSEFGGKA
jgi:hypothetical protein